MKDSKLLEFVQKQCTKVYSQKEYDFEMSLKADFSIMKTELMKILELKFDKDFAEWLSTTPQNLSKVLRSKLPLPSKYRYMVLIWKLKTQDEKKAKFN